MKKYLLMATLLLGTVYAGEIEPKYEDDNVSGLYYDMHYNCEIFDAETGVQLEDDDDNKCKIMVFVDGNATREATEEEIQWANDDEKQRERMYGDE